MSSKEYLEKIKNVQSTLLEFLEKEVNAEEIFQNLCSILNNFINNDKNQLRLFLHLISKISKNYHDGPHINNKIIRVIEYLEESIKKNLSNSEIFKFSKTAKEFFYFLLKRK